MKQCMLCGKQFTPHMSNPNSKRTKYCSPECSSKASIKRNTENRRKLNLGARLGLSGGKIGKIAEQLVAIDLLKKGYEVYVAFEDTHPFDILAIKDDKTIKIEVKSATILPSGLRVIAGMYKMKNKEGKYDVLATVTNLLDIEYSKQI